jgi:hypothetical protein
MEESEIKKKVIKCKFDHERERERVNEMYFKKNRLNAKFIIKRVYEK